MREVQGTFDGEFFVLCRLENGVVTLNTVRWFSLSPGSVGVKTIAQDRAVDEYIR